MAVDTSQLREFHYGWPVVLASTLGIFLGMAAGLAEEQIDAFDDPENGSFTDAEKAVLALGDKLARTQPEGTLNPVSHQKIARLDSAAEILELGLVGGILAGVAKFMPAYDVVENEDTCLFHSAR